MLRSLLAAVSLVALQDLVLEREEVLPLELGGGVASHVLDCTVVAAGMLYAWADSEALDPELTLLDRVSGRQLGRDDGRGGARTPYLAVKVESGQELRVVVEARVPGDEGALTLHLVPTEESEATRAAARAADESLAKLDARRAAGDPDGARELAILAIAEIASTPGVQRSPIATLATWKLADAASRLGATAAAAEAWAAVEERLARWRPEDHDELHVARKRLAVAWALAGELRAALELQERLLASLERLHSAEHEEVLSARTNLAQILRECGELARARELEEGVFHVYSRTVAADDPRLQTACENLAITLRAQGELHDARELLERSLSMASATLSPDSTELAVSRLNLAVVSKDLGDFAAARELEEQALEVLEQALPEDHATLQIARTNLATTLERCGEGARARELLELALAVLERTRLDGDAELAAARSILGLHLLHLGQVEDACGLLEQVLLATERALPESHPELQTARANLAFARKSRGELEVARGLEERALDALERSLPEGHDDLLQTRENLAVTLSLLGHREEALAVGSELAVGLREGLRAALFRSSPRELEERVRRMSNKLSTLLSLSGGAWSGEPDEQLDRAIFHAIESLRSAALIASELRASGVAELAALQEDEARASAELARLALTGSGRDELAAARRALDQVRRELGRRIADRPGARAALAEPTVEALAARLSAGDALVGWWRYRRWLSETDSVESLLAFVVRPGGELVRVELGPAEAIEAAVARWRVDLGIHASGRGVGVDARAGDSGERESARRVRELAFDPLRGAVGDALRLVVALDDVLHGVALDALPEGDGLLGDGRAIEVCASLRELLRARAPASGPARLVAVGDIDFGAALEQAERGGAAAGLLRGSAWEHGFKSLPHTGTEVHAIARLHAEVFGGDPPAKLITGAQATRAALLEEARSARYLHLATHGWFAPESIPSSIDGADSDASRAYGAPLSRAEQVRGTSPMLLCGLALAGANRPVDELGRLAGLVTAEELAGLDLSACELVVLSACDTNVGVRRAGQGVASLQKALHMAGARCALTSLWKVPDAATAELMEGFYRRMWAERKPKARALWEAKMQLRDARDAAGQARYSTRDWAGWTLSGGTR